MGQFIAWIASRRKTQRGQAAGASGGRATRSLFFERCEQRIALSTNAGYEPFPLNVVDLDGGEGGFIVVANGAGFTLSNWRANVVRAFSTDDSAADQWSWTNAYDSGYQTNSGAGVSALTSQLNFGIELNSHNIRQHSGWLGSFDTFTDADFTIEPAGILITESKVVPIPPPAEPGGSEGGQISMIPFIGPSMFSLPAANESQLAVRTRHALGEEQVESTPAAAAPEVNSLRGRAVVYEVAQARSLSAASDEADAGDFGFGETGRNRRALDALETAEARRDAVSDHVAVRHVGTAPQDVGDSISTQHAATKAVFVRTSLGEEQQAADDDAKDPSAKAEAASARDAVFDELEHGFGPLNEQREAAAATAEANQRRIVGGALIAVAAVPILKTVRRKGRQQAIEIRPPRPAHA